jgi:hypothetical protein
MAAPKLLDSMRALLRTRHYSIRTEETYVQWAKRYILFQGKKHPSAMGAPEINEFLTHLAVGRNVSDPDCRRYRNGRVRSRAAIRQRLIGVRPA